MATFDYNPITGQLDLVGGGASYIDGVVADSSLLPVTLGTPALDAVYLAKVGSGVWLLNRKPAGLYVRVANNGVAADWTYLGAFPEVNSSANWSLYDGTTPSKELKFDLAGISTSTVRTLTVPDASGRIQVEGQPIGNTTAAAATFTTLTANTSLTLNGTGAAELINAGAAAGPLRIYNTFTSATNHERGFLRWSSNVFQIGTEKGSGGGTARALEFQTDGVTRMTLATNGLATFSSSVVAGGAGFVTNQALTLSSNFAMAAQALTATLDCTSNPAGIRLYGLGNAGGSATNTERLHISTRTGNSYFISTQATGTGTARALEIRTADVARLTFEAAGGLTLADANDIAVGTTTGTKIGTATSQKIGFFNATPAVQPAAVADATDAASTQARLNDLLARLRTLGLIAT